MPGRARCSSLPMTSSWGWGQSGGAAGRQRPHLRPSLRPWALSSAASQCFGPCSSVEPPHERRTRAGRMDGAACTVRCAEGSQTSLIRRTCRPSRCVCACVQYTTEYLSRPRRSFRRPPLPCPVCAARRYGTIRSCSKAGKPLPPQISRAMPTSRPGLLINVTACQLHEEMRNTQPARRQLPAARRSGP